MAKLDECEREDYKVLKARLNGRNLEFIQDEQTGITIAKCDHDGGNFCRVAIAYCSQLDKWNKKRGKFEALIKLDEIPQYILVPKYIGPEEYEFIIENI